MFNTSVFNVNVSELMYMFLRVSTVTRTNIDSFNLTIKNHQSKISFHIKFCEIDKEHTNNQLQHLHNELKHFTSELKYTFSTIILVNELINKKRNPHWRCFLCFLYDFTDAAYFEYSHHLSLIKKLNLQVVIFSSENKWEVEDDEATLWFYYHCCVLVA